MRAPPQSTACCPWQTEVFNSCSIGRSERCADWIRRARRNRSEQCEQRRNQQRDAPGKQRFLKAAASGVASGVQIGYGERAETGMGVVPMRISSTPRIQYACRAVANKGQKKPALRRVKVRLCSFVEVTPSALITPHARHAGLHPDLRVLLLQLHAGPSQHQ